MKESITSPDVYVAHTRTERGRGVFARRPFTAGEVVEACPVILLTRPYRKLARPLQTVVFDWAALGGDMQGCALALGYGSIYNHADPSNMTTSACSDRRCLVYTAARDIKQDEELTINYNAYGGAESSKNGNWWFRRLDIEPIE